MIAFLSAWVHDTWSVIEESGVWLLIGLSIAAVLRLFVPTSFVERHLKNPGIGSILKASAAGVPLPLCSCSVIPVAVALRRKGAGKGATASFMVSTPEIGVDSFLLSYGLLGPVIAFLRAFSAFMSAMVVGLLVDRFASDDAAVPAPAPVAACCEKESTAATPSFLRSFFELLDDISPSLMIGFLVSGLITALLPFDFFTSLGLNNFLLMLLMLVVSLPTYVCASASTPLAAALMARGLPIGATLVFLLAGPATNLATVLVVRSELGAAAAACYVGGIAVVTMVIGTAADLWLTELVASGAGAHAGHAGHESMFSTGAAVILFVLLLFCLVRRAKIRAQRPVAAGSNPIQPKPACH